MSGESITITTRTLVAGMYDAAVRGDFASVMACFTDELLVHEPASLSIAGTYRGPEAFAAVIAKLAETMDFTRMRVARMTIEGERAVSILHIPDRTTGQDIVVAEESLLRDGKVAEIWIYYHDGQSMS
jgi:uncharacterized protein